MRARDLLYPRDPLAVQKSSLLMLAGETEGANWPDMQCNLLGIHSPDPVGSFSIGTFGSAETSGRGPGRRGHRYYTLLTSSRRYREKHSNWSKYMRNAVSTTCRPAIGGSLATKSRPCQCGLAKSNGVSSWNSSRDTERAYVNLARTEWVECDPLLFASQHFDVRWGQQYSLPQAFNWSPRAAPLAHIERAECR